MITVRNKRNYNGPGIYVGRPSVLGNRARMEDESQRDWAVEQFRIRLRDALASGDLATMTAILNILVAALAGEANLICWCTPKRCHADVIKECVESIMETGSWEGIEFLDIALEKLHGNKESSQPSGL